MPFAFRRRKARRAGNGYNVPADVGPSTVPRGTPAAVGRPVLFLVRSSGVDTFDKVIKTDTSCMETDQISPDGGLA